MPLTDTSDITHRALGLERAAADLDTSAGAVARAAAQLHWSSPAHSAFADALSLLLRQVAQLGDGVRHTAAAARAHVRTATDRAAELERMSHAASSLIPTVAGVLERALR